jgi:hypothetical protein
MLVSWDDEIPNIWKNKKMFQTINQSKFSPASHFLLLLVPFLVKTHQAAAHARTWW